MCGVLSFSFVVLGHNNPSFFFSRIHSWIEQQCGREVRAANDKILKRVWCCLLDRRGRYSGDPSEAFTYEYAKTVLDLVTQVCLCVFQRVCVCVCVWVGGWVGGCGCVCAVCVCSMRVHACVRVCVRTRVCTRIMNLGGVECAVVRVISMK